MRRFDSKKKAYDRERLLELLANAGLTITELKRLAIENHYSPAMLVDMIIRDHDDIITQFSFTKRSIINLFKTIGVVHDNKLYLKLAQEVKLQFKYPKGTSLEEIKAICSSQSSKGAKTTCNMRKTWSTYTPKNHVNYYIDKGYAPDEARKRAIAFRKSKSPFSKSFSKYRFMSNDIVNVHISELSRNRGLLGLISMRAGVSKLEISVVDELRKHNIHCETQKILGKFAYDIFVPSSNLIIEVNGTYWHADPRVYSADELVHFPYGQLKASEKWARDEVKLSYARSLSYDVHVLWELDLQKEGYIDEFIRTISNI